MSATEAPVTIVDTAGTSRASLNKYIRQADIIVVPFQPHVADLETVVGWFLSINEELQERVVFVPNRLTHTKEGIVNFMGISAESAREVGRSDLFEAIFRPSVGRPSMMVAVNTRRVGDVLPLTH